MVNLTDQIIGVESGGNPYAKNPRSSATGAGQFISSTWLDMINRHRPDLAQGRSREEILQMRNDPNLSRDMTQAYADQNAAFLRSKGYEPTPVNTYLSHFAGPAGSAAILANPGATVEALLGPEAVRANPFLQGMTGQDVIDWAGRKMSPSQAMAKNLKKRFGTPETAQGPAAAPDDMGRLKAALSGKTYDPDNLSGADRLIDQGQSIASTSGNPWGAIGGTILAGLGGYERGQERGNEKAYREELGQTLSGSENPIDMARKLMTSPDPKLQEAGIDLYAKASMLAQKGGTQTAAIKEYELAKSEGFQGSFADFLKEKKAPLVTIQGEEEYAKTRGKALGEEFGAIQTNAQQATDRIGQLRQIDDLLSNPKVYTGTGAEAINALKRAAQTLFGQESIEGVADADAARRISTEMALSLKENLPGPMSDSDREFLQSIPPNIGDTAQGRKLLVSLMTAKEQRKIELAELAREYAEQKGGRLDDGWYSVVGRYNAQNPVFTDEMMESARNVSSQARQPSPAAGVLPR
ncbi:MAG TPA: hypothetical protein VKA94_00335, partial [Hyphomicrobiales bacterium]|nr:hypothetical protein [Hyphomicrobiales bacterium]